MSQSLLDYSIQTVGHNLTHFLVIYIPCVGSALVASSTKALQWVQCQPDQQDETLSLNKKIESIPFPQGVSCAPCKSRQADEGRACACMDEETKVRASQVNLPWPQKDIFKIYGSTLKSKSRLKSRWNYTSWRYGVCPHSSMGGESVPSLPDVPEKLSSHWDTVIFRTAPTKLCIKQLC